MFDNDTEFYDSKTNSSLYTAYLGYSITADEASDPTYNSSDICLDISPD